MIMNKPVCLGLSILYISKKVWVCLRLCKARMRKKQKQKKKKKLSYNDKNGFRRFLSRDDEARFDNSNWEISRPLPTG